MSVVPLKGEHHENWHALIASIAEENPDVREGAAEDIRRWADTRREREIADLIRRFHRNACYPEAMSGEVDAVVAQITELYR